MKITQLGFVALAGVSLACASKPAAVTVTGDVGDRTSLAGKWSGEYNSPATGRSGSIVFNLSPSGEAANGDVVMDAYRDPECDCPVVTTFIGTPKSDTIDGTFSTRGSQSNTPQTGNWRVKRTR